MGLCVPFTAWEKCGVTHAKIRWVALAMFVCLVTICGTTPLVAQSPSFTDFSSIPTPDLVLNGDWSKVGSALRLTSQDTQKAGSAWFNLQQPVTGGFTTTFTFRITKTNVEAIPADGIAFVIQNAPVTEGAPFGGVHALAGTGGAIGYSDGFAVPFNGDTTTTGIPNSLAIEFDTFQNAGPGPNNDPNANHVAVQSCGTDPNSADHYATHGESSVPCNLGINANLTSDLADGAAHTVKIEYTSPIECDCGGKLQVTLDGTDLFTIGNENQITSLDLASLLALGEGGTAWVGFTAATGDAVESNDILSWTFTPHVSETITINNLPANVFTTFNFGSYLYKVKPDQNIDSLSVTEVPTDFFSFNAGSNFPAAKCIIYDNTGGKCVEFHAACSGATCNNVNYDVVTSYDVPSGPAIQGPGFLKATGQDCVPGITFDQNIITAFLQTRTDPTTKGSSKPTFSCFVAVRDLQYAPADLDIVNLASPKVKPNSNLTYAATATNFGPSGAQGVAITNTIPAGTQYVSSALCTLSGGCSPTPCSFDGTAVSCTVGNMDRFALEFMLVTVKVTAPAGTIIRDTANITSFNPDPDRRPDRSWTAVTLVSNR